MSTNERMSLSDFAAVLRARTRADLVRLAGETNDPATLAAVSMVLLLIACAKSGETFLESRDALRRIIPQAEQNLFESWDLYRQLQ